MLRIGDASLVVVLASIMSTLACSGGSFSSPITPPTTLPSEPPPATLPSEPPTQLIVFPVSPPSIVLHGAVTMKALGTYGDPGSANPTSIEVTKFATWSSSDEDVATVVAGVVNGTDLGSATITATIQGKTASSAVTVGIQPDISVTPSDLGAFSLSHPNRQFVATAKYIDGTVLDLTGWVKWSASPEGIVKFDDPYGLQPGLATFISTGTATITATFKPGAVEAEGVLNVTVEP
jgi:Bacterial Ig-like domain (group 2)